MTSEIKNLPELSLFSCPFYNTCVLPKNQFCRLPECKICIEYIAILKKYNPKGYY